MRNVRSLAPVLLVLLVAGCAAPSTPPASEPTAEPAPAPAPMAAPSAPPSSTTPAVASAGPASDAPDDARGGRLYDSWYAEKQLGDAFAPDDAKTPAADGKGGPNGNGTLRNGSGAPLLNPGHDYRLKNLFGWDLRGSAGLYGTPYQKKATVHEVNLLEDPRPTAELLAWLWKGDAKVPAYGEVLDEKDRRDLGAFLERIRAKALPGPADVFALSKSAPKNYTLNAGADAGRGKTYFAGRCADCHGADGRDIPIDGTESVGTLSRTSGYEIWLKILNGHPGSKMDRQVPDGPATEQAAVIRDVLAALCDRTAFPPQKDGKDVPKGDARCGAYLK